MNCLIVDDEPIARSIIKTYIEKISSLNLIGECKNALEAISYLHQYKIDILFLDIKMPDMSGIELLKTLFSKPNVILTTAYSEFAVESYEFQVIDYLLKPFSFERFLKAINKINPNNNKTECLDKHKIPNHIYLKEDKKVHKVLLNEILYIQSYGNYIKVFTKDHKLMVQETLLNILSILPDKMFVRIHKSYIVSVDKVLNYDSSSLHIKEAKLPIGKYYKQNFLEKLKIIG